MSPLHRLVCLAVISGVSCGPTKLGIFEGVMVQVKDLRNASSEARIFIEFDDSLSDNIGKSSQIVTITGQHIPKLETNSVTNLPHVRNLTMSKNGIREIRRGTFKNLPSLQVLDLSHNLVEDVRNGVFNGLPVTDLRLDHNRIANVGYKAFSNLRLKRLLLNDNRISRWSKDWLADASVTLLNAASNLIAELPHNSFYLMAKPANDTMSVFFGDNRLTEIGNDVFFGFETFKDVYLDGNAIQHLSSGALNGVKYIKNLNLNGNRIGDISGDLLAATRVDVLMLEDNRLTCLSTDLFQVEELDIDGNPISCSCVKLWLDWRETHSNPSIYHITDLERQCI